METNSLQTFIEVVHNGSFSQTAANNFISSTAVMKQINKLEQELDTKLLNRSPAGVSLTSSGQSFLQSAQTIVKLVNQSYLECHQLSNNVEVIRLGTSLLHPSTPFLSVWGQLKKEIPNYQIKITQLNDDLKSNNREYAMLGHQCDIMIGTFEHATTRQLVSAIPLGTYQFGIAVRSDNLLAQKELLTLDDLSNQRILMVPTGISEKNDQLRATILKKNPTAKIQYTDGRYDINVFNQAVDENAALINLTPWENIHPNLVTIPLKTSIKVEYGILAAKNANSLVKNFMAMIKQYLA